MQGGGIGDSGSKLRETERIEVVKVIRRLPPDTKALKYWLKNRQPEHWREEPPSAKAPPSTED